MHKMHLPLACHSRFGKREPWPVSPGLWLLYRKLCWVLVELLKYRRLHPLLPPMKQQILLRQPDHLRAELPPLPVQRRD